ncbi:probable plastid-lipid-associated protein 11, chloroplastic isoform X2 [Rhododendron vialii]|uniref:probable plastid-lipid-associated protein 11, chloroplastic isoform X2 n=1 Tax=Rhododendron vialii TaxID=182163 RepID=UPI00265FB2C9|nr:probable plastid-lipid-associated protein 11, chloroplastic isoform X2 [Rhododendron vialii]XP_058221649.1 probable plastid-lipid-associated protein 11, chloroplastic isoform X2 [Rhododendron vialii]XP_058221650.1 probable plastid-lipid-associated protein 11, chloroplastic isoform X2 [Rhododendron vialii]
MSKILSLPAISSRPNPNPNPNPDFPNPHRHRRTRATTLTLTRSSLTDQSLSSAAAKRDLLDLISDQDRGLRTQNDPSRLSKIVEAIDALAVSGCDTVTTGPSLSGTWRLMWTTEKEQLFIIKNAYLFGTRTGDVLQVIDVDQGVLNNVITFPPHGVFFVRSTVEIASTQRVNFRFRSIYLDDGIRVAKDIRGDYLVVDRAPYEWKE